MKKTFEQLSTLFKPQNWEREEGFPARLVINTDDFVSTRSAEIILT